MTVSAATGCCDGAGMTAKRIPIIGYGEMGWSMDSKPPFAPFITLIVSQTTGLIGQGPVGKQKI